MSGTKVVRASLPGLQDRDAAVERWLHAEVVSTYDAMQADPTRAIAADQVFAALRARHADRARRPTRYGTATNTAS